MKKLALAFALAGAVLLTGCTTAPTKVASQGVRSILVVPPANETNTVGADLMMLSRLPQSTAEKGYYVFPVDTVKMVLENEGLYEGERIQQMPPAKLTEMFHADSVLFVKVKYWDAKYSIFNTDLKVTVDYELFAKDGTSLVKGTETRSQDLGAPSLNPLELAIKAVQAAIVRAAPNYKLVGHNTAFFMTNRWETGPYLTVSKQ